MHMTKKWVALPLLVLILIGCSSTESNTESSTSLVPQLPRRDTVLAVNRCVDGSDGAIYGLEYFFSIGEFTASDTVHKYMKIAVDDCDEAALQARTDDVQPLVASIDDFLFALRGAAVKVLLVDIDLSAGKNPTWDQSETTSVRNAYELFLKSVSKFGITPN